MGSVAPSSLVRLYLDVLEIAWGRCSADCIDDVELLRCGSTASVLGRRVTAASTVGTWLRSFTFGHVRQLDKVTGVILARAWAAGAGPGDGPLMVDVDSTICEVHGYHKQGACYGYTHRLGYHPLLATRADTGEVLHARLRKGAANTRPRHPPLRRRAGGPPAPRGRLR
jgi:Transposase DDE domain group 1